MQVAGLTPGMSADLSGVILPGDDVLEVDGVNTVQLTLEDLRNKIAGKRGTKVCTVCAVKSLGLKLPVC